MGLIELFSALVHNEEVSTVQICSANVTLLDTSAFSAATLLCRSFREIFNNPCEEADTYKRDVKQISAPANLSELRRIPVFSKTLQILYRGKSRDPN